MTAQVEEVLEDAEVAVDVEVLVDVEVVDVEEVLEDVVLKILDLQKW